MDIKANEHIFIAGRTRSGKTTAARILLAKVKRLIVCDSKGTLRNWNTVEWNKDNRKKFERDEPLRMRVTPPLDGDESEFWNEIFDWAYDAGNCRIYVDELYAVTNEGKTIPQRMKTIYTRGAEFNVTFCGVAQRPASISLLPLSEASHYFCFRLNMHEDRLRCAKFMGEEVLAPITDRHGFWYYGGDLDAPLYFSDIMQTKNAGVKGTVTNGIESRGR